jgi:endonuclease YncB( thermonuclease family)
MAKSRILGFLVLILLLFLLAYFYPQVQELTGQATQSTSQDYPKETAILLRVIDGDTIELDNGEHVRLLGINTPEKNMPFANASKNFLRKFENKTIILERDKEDIDKYKRKLRYIYFENEFINLEILELGLANSYYTRGLKYESQVLNAESQAKNLGIGIWTKSSDSCSSCIGLKELNSTEEFFIIQNNCENPCVLDGWFVKDAGRNTFYLSNLSAGESKTYHSKNNSEVWNNDGDRFFLFDKKGYLTLFYEYK